MARAEKSGKRSEVEISALNGKLDVANNKLTTQEKLSREHRLSNHS